MIFGPHDAIPNRCGSDDSDHALLADNRSDPARPDDFRDCIEIALSLATRPRLVAVGLRFGKRQGLG